MRQIPMLFSPAMIKALLAGRKTETRRILKRPTDHFHASLTEPRIDALGKLWWWDGKSEHSRRVKDAPIHAGDLIWVRENCQAIELENGDDVVRYPADGSEALIASTMDAAERWGKMHHYAGKRGAVIPSIHMPKWASRLTLRVTSYNIERLHDIDEAGAIAEGVTREILRGSQSIGEYLTEPLMETGIAAYERLWDQINGAGAWAQNPWVSVTKFEVIRKKLEAVQ